MTTTVLITGAAGNMGRMLRPLLRRSDRTLRLFDIAGITDLDPTEEYIQGSVTDRAAVARAVEGVDAIVHLGGLSTEDSWENILAVNVDGTQAIFDAAVTHGVTRVVYASSNHAVGFWTHDESDGMLAGDVAPRPDGFYGWSKAAGEALARLYHDRFGIDVVNLRIGSSFDRPPNYRGLASWMSPADTARLIEASLSDSAKGFHIVWGISANTRAWWSGAEGETIGYVPQDNSEIFADEFLRDHEWTFDDPILQRAGGAFCDHPLGQRM
ncbi:NAD-dependent epimerase/dehydratase family protein [Rhodococcus sp. MEB064]|uniref:NAD-dependent epimerase/dehydratase family protein n=1 Tax=Rhodococcus sp. MEB064 TaxID=1587522 RepID=UPI0005ACD212|nr:NAD(P)-dependent oxidoreductase [Rhodococcus sp. MEB064]KIQ10864.1 NAD-dependent dehydratase [Rhodococcus sp. MEB064]